MPLHFVAVLGRENNSRGRKIKRKFILGKIFVFLAFVLSACSTRSLIIDRRWDWRAHYRQKESFSMAPIISLPPDLFFVPERILREFISIKKNRLFLLIYFSFLCSFNSSSLSVERNFFVLSHLHFFVSLRWDYSKRICDTTCFTAPICTSLLVHYR